MPAMRWSWPTVRAAARRSPTAADGPRCTSRASWRRRSARLVAPAPREEGDAAEQHGHAKPLAHRHAERQEPQEGVRLPGELGEETQAAVADQEHRRYLSSRARLGREPPQEGEEHEPLERELVEL